MLIKAARLLFRSATIALLLSIVLSAAVYFWHSKMMNVPGPHQDDVLVVIEPGSGHQTLRLVLDRAGVLHQIYHYDAARLLAGKSFSPKAGEFLLPARTNLNDVLSIIHKGYGHQRRLTIVEGLRSADVVKLINAMPNLAGAIKSMPDEGRLRPETYFYTHATPRQDLINRMQEAQKLILAEAWNERAKHLPYDTPQDALIMASIIEKEASLSGDRRLVAAVLINRLKKGMRLYESVFIARQDISTTQVETMADEFAEIITSDGGSIKKREYWGLRTLAYRIKKNRKGHYVMFNLETGPEALKEYERIMGLNEDVLRFLNIRLEEIENGPSIMMQAKTDRPQRNGYDDRDDGDRNKNNTINTDSAADGKNEG